MRYVKSSFKTSVLMNAPHLGEVHSGLCQIFKIKLSTLVVKSLLLLITFAKTPSKMFGKVLNSPLVVVDQICFQQKKMF